MLHFDFRPQTTLKNYCLSSALVEMASSEPSATASHSNGPTFSLENILGNDHDKLEHPDVKPEGWDEEDTERELAHGYCVECEGAWHLPSPVSCPI